MSELTKVEIVRPPRERVRPQVIDLGQGRTHQEMKDDVDVNLIVNAWRNTGTNPHVNLNDPYYGDVTAAGDLQTNLNAVMEADALYRDLPAAVRDASGNNPVEFLAMLNDDEAREELLEAGLRIEQPPATPDPDPEIPPVTEEIPPTTEEPLAPVSGGK